MARLLVILPEAVHDRLHLKGGDGSDWPAPIYGFRAVQYDFSQEPEAMFRFADAVLLSCELRPTFDAECWQAYWTIARLKSRLLRVYGGAARMDGT